MRYGYTFLMTDLLIVHMDIKAPIQSHYSLDYQYQCDGNSEYKFEGSALDFFSDCKLETLTGLARVGCMTDTILAVLGCYLGWGWHWLCLCSMGRKVRQIPVH